MKREINFHDYKRYLKFSFVIVIPFFYFMEETGIFMVVLLDLECQKKYVKRNAACGHDGAKRGVCSTDVGMSQNLWRCTENLGLGL